MVVKIHLSKGLQALVDKPISGNKFVATNSSGRWYAVRGRGRHRIYLHRLIAGATKGVFVDHINGNTLDNRKENLRLCTHQQNIFNGKKRNPKSGYKGVARYNAKWGARITVNGKSIHLGVFRSKVKAAKVYDEAARKYFGEFANTNF